MHWQQWIFFAISFGGIILINGVDENTNTNPNLITSPIKIKSKKVKFETFDKKRNLITFTQRIIQKEATLVGDARNCIPFFQNSPLQSSEPFGKAL